MPPDSALPAVFSPGDRAIPQYGTLLDYDGGLPQRGHATGTPQALEEDTMSLRGHRPDRLPPPPSVPSGSFTAPPAGPSVAAALDRIAAALEKIAAALAANNGEES